MVAVVGPVCLLLAVFWWWVHVRGRPCFLYFDACCCQLKRIKIKIVYLKIDRCSFQLLLALLY